MGGSVHSPGVWEGVVLRERGAGVERRALVLSVSFWCKFLACVLRGVEFKELGGAIAVGASCSECGEQWREPKSSSMIPMVRRAQDRFLGLIDPVCSSGPSVD